jgi:hypothetical protein
MFDKKSEKVLKFFVAPMSSIFEIVTRGRRNKRYELWRSFDFGDGSPVRLELLDSFYDYIQASERRRLEIEEAKRAETPNPSRG